MKTRILSTIILILISTTLFSQNEIKSKIDKTILNESLSTDLNNLSLQKKPGKQIELYNIQNFKGKVNDSILQIIPKSLDSTMLSLEQNQNFATMPIFKPQGQFNMPVSVPDSTIDFKLKIQGMDSDK